MHMKKKCVSTNIFVLWEKASTYMDELRRDRLPPRAPFLPHLASSLGALASSSLAVSRAAHLPPPPLRPAIY